MVNAQDKALATLCIERGLLDDAAVERARQAHAETLGRGEPPPLGNLLVQRGFLQPAIAAGLLRELALASFLCPRCERSWSYEELAQLTRYRCESCGERLVRKSRSTRSTVAPRPEVTEVDRGRASSARVVAATPAGVRNTAVSLPVPHIPGGSGTAPVVAPRASSGTRPVATGPSGARASATGLLRPSDVGKPGPSSTAGLITPSGKQPTAPAAARTLGPYEILSELGRGAMGVVYLGRRPGLERLFAIKVLLGGALADPEAVERFRREAALASRVQHPNVVPVYDVGTANGFHYYVMEHCPGRTLKQVLEQRGRFPAEEAASLVSKIARGVGAAHALGVVHRDVKPANVMMEARTGNPRVADFGLARDASQGDTGVTRTGDLVGTPSYMAPEQLIGKKGVDARADVYALGVVLYELLAGVRPFHAETTAELAAKVLSEDPKPLRSHVPDVPAGIDAIVAKAISKEPERRYENANEVALDLERFLAGETVQARPEGRVGRAWRRSKGKILAVAGGVLLVGGAIGLMTLRAIASEREQERLKREGEAERERNARKEQQGALKAIDESAQRGRNLEQVKLAIADLTKSAPSLAPQLQATLAVCLARRGQYAAAFEIAQKLTDLPGREGLEMHRIVAESLLRRNDPLDAAPHLKALEAATEGAFADWVKLRRQLAEPRATGMPAGVSEANVRRDFWCSRIAVQLRFRERDLEQAESLLVTALTTASSDPFDSDDALAHLLMARVLRSKREADSPDSKARADGRKHFDTFANLVGDELASFPDGLVQRAQIAFDEHRYSDLVRDLDAAMDAGSEDPGLFATRALFPDDRGEKCAALAKEAHVQVPDVSHLPLELKISLATALLPEARKRLAAVAARAQEPARASLEKALALSASGERTDLVLTAFDVCQRAAPRCPVVAVERARALMSRGQLKDALDAIAAARSLPGASLAELGLLEADATSRRGLRAEASELAAAVGVKDKDGVFGSLGKSLAARIAGDGDAAVAAARQAAEKAPDSAAAQRFLARAHLLAGERGDAEDAIRKALALEAVLDGDNEFVLIGMETRTPIAVPLNMMMMGHEGGGGGLDALLEPLRARQKTWDVYLEQFPSPEHFCACAISRIEAAAKLMETMKPLEQMMQRFERGERYGGGEHGDRINMARQMKKQFQAEFMEPTKAMFDKAARFDRESPFGEEGLGFYYYRVEKAPDTALQHWKAARAVAPRWQLPPWLEQQLGDESPALLEKLKPSK